MSIFKNKAAFPAIPPTAYRGGGILFEYITNGYPHTATLRYVCARGSMKHIPLSMLNYTSMLSILIDTYLESFKALLQPSETEYGEAQYWLDLPCGQSLEITHETYDLSEDEQFWSWRVHCSDEEFDNNDYHGTVGIIDTRCTTDNDEKTFKEMLSWAIHIAITEFED